MALFRRLPRRLVISVLDGLAVLVYRLDYRHRHIARVNLWIAFPELSELNRERIALRSFQHTARNLLEVSRIPMLSKSTVGPLVSYDEEMGLDNYLAARRQQRPILYLTGHFSAWELLPSAHAVHGFPLSFVTRPLDNRFLERHLRALREFTGNRVIPKKASVRPILQSLKASGEVGILMDQNVSPQEGVFADFFGLPAATSTSLALLALRTGALVVPGYLKPMQDGSYRIRFLPPMEPVRTGDKARDIQTNTEAFNQVLEAIIREQPETWLWGHKRWKNQPPEGPPDLYALSWNELQEYVGRYRNPSSPAC